MPPATLTGYVSISILHAIKNHLTIAFKTSSAAVATLGEQRPHTPGNSIALDLVLTLASSFLQALGSTQEDDIPCDFRGW